MATEKKLSDEAGYELPVEDVRTLAVSSQVDPTAEKALRRKQDMRIIPLSAGIYFLCYLDRSNIGNAKVLNASTHHDLLSETGMTNYQYTISLMMLHNMVIHFLVAYGVFEVPSNILLKKLRPSRWIAFLMFAWGALTIGLGGVHSYAAVTVVRFLLGVFEAGLFPGLVYYLTFWYKTEERSVRVAFILASATLAGAFGGAIAYGVGHMNQAGGLSAWRWLFIIEGAPSCLSALFVFLFLPDYPEGAKWLSEEERAIAVQRLSIEGSKGHHNAMTWPEAKETLCDWRLWGHYLVYFGISTPFSSLSLFTPSITAGLGFKDLEAQLMTVPPYAVAYVVQILTSYSADYFNARGLHSAILATIGAIGFLASAVLPADAYSARYGCLIVAASGAFSCIPPLLGWLSSNIFATASVGLAIALNIGLGGAPGQIVGVFIYKPEEAKAGYPTGHWVNAALLLMVAVGCVMLRLYYGWRNRKLLKAAGAGAGAGAGSGGDGVDVVRLFKY
ncbi:MFS transporter-like protein [Apiospora saccharicola]|uniref:MFS transporter-like protein n=1 Tax=Apiospora saccharicola TaxID=335842 RepID=A0ABR1UWU8_9PEZI